MFCLVRLLLSITVLACPLNCMGALEDGGEAGQRKLSRCSCCSHCAAEENSAPAERPGFPSDDDRDYGNCLCQGAVVNADQVALDLEQIDDCFLAVELVPATSNQVSSGVPDWWFAPPASLITGRCARILHQSFLL